MILHRSTILVTSLITSNIYDIYESVQVRSRLRALFGEGQEDFTGVVLLPGISSVSFISTKIIKIKKLIDPRSLLDLHPVHLILLGITFQNSH